MSTILAMPLTVAVSFPSATSSLRRQPKHTRSDRHDRCVSVSASASSSSSSTPAPAVASTPPSAGSSRRCYAVHSKP